MTVLMAALRVRLGREEDDMSRLGEKPHLTTWTVICVVGALAAEAARFIGG